MIQQLIVKWTDKSATLFADGKKIASTRNSPVGQIYERIAERYNDYPRLQVLASSKLKEPA